MRNGRRWRIILSTTTLLIGVIALGLGSSELALAKGKPPRPPSSPADPALAFVTEVSNIEVANADGSNRTVVYEGTELISPTWSPDGEHIAFLQGWSELWRIDIAVVDGAPTGSNATALLDTEQIYDVAWSPAGDEIAFLADQGTHQTLEAIPAPGGTPRVLYVGPSDAGLWGPTWSPDADRIAFLQGDDIKILDVEAGTLATISVAGGAWGLDWARTQDILAFESAVPKAKKGTERWVHTVDLDTGQVTRWTKGRVNTWSPDDERILILEGTRTISAYEFASGGLEPILTRLSYLMLPVEWRR